MAFENLKSTGIKYLLGKLKTVFLQIKDAVKMVNGIEPNENGNIVLPIVPYSQNLLSEFNQRTEDTYIDRTAGGSASVQTGEQTFVKIQGNSVHEGYVPEELTMIVTPADPGSVTAISATIDRDIYVQQAEAGVTTFEYTTEWNLNPASYGITVTGTPVNGDTIEVTYVAEERGTITQSDPESLVATGWNLYNDDVGYARVLKYSDDPNEVFGISGTYTGIKFSSTLEGTQTTVDVTEGKFSIEEDGYIWVTGGNSTDTAIWMTWSDWQGGYPGSFEAYTEHEVDFSSVMSAYFQNGLLKAGSIVDEINFTAAKAYSRVEVWEYTEANRAVAAASGKQYEFDEQSIYIERDTVNEYTIDISGEIIVNDHGLEIVTHTDVPVTVEMLYGVNLKNRLEHDVVTKSGDIANNLNTTTEGKALDARQGKVLKDTIDNTQAVSAVSSPITWGTSYAAGDAANRDVTMIKCGKVRTLSMYFKPNSATSGWTTIATIASGHRPYTLTTDAYYYAYVADYSSVKRMRVNSSGELQMLARGTDTYYLTMTYLTA